MHGSFLPQNRPLFIVDPWMNVLADPQGNQVGWDGPVLADGSNLSTVSRGRVVHATVTEDTRRL